MIKYCQNEKCNNPLTGRKRKFCCTTCGGQDPETKRRYNETYRKNIIPRKETARNTQEALEIIKKSATEPSKIVIYFDNNGPVRDEDYDWI